MVLATQHLFLIIINAINTLPYIHIWKLTQQRIYIIRVTYNSCHYIADGDWFVI